MVEASIENKGGSGGRVDGNSVVESVTFHQTKIAETMALKWVGRV